MSNLASPMKKPTPCRYFANSGSSCLHGNDCQFLHENPRANRKQQPAAENSTGNESAGSDGNNGDQFFNATFNSNGLSEFPPFPSRPKSSRSPLGAIAQQTSPGSQPAEVTEQMASLSVSSQARPQQAQQQGQQQQGQQQQQQQSLQTPQFQGRNPAATEFVPKASSPATVGSSNLGGSSPSYPVFSQGGSVNHTAGGLTTGASPLASPRLSPSGSPMASRRNNSATTAGAAAATPTTTYVPTENVGGTTYFYSNDDLVNNAVPHQSTNSAVVLPNFTMYPGILPHVAHMKPKSNQPSFFMPDDLKMEILNRHTITMAQIDQEAAPDIPQEVDNYHNLFPLEPHYTNPMHKSTTFCYPTSVYKATNVKDGMTYCLRRVHGFRLVNTKCMSFIDLWKKIQHASLVQLREVFTTKAFNDHSIVFVYDFHPGAETLMMRHFSQHHHHHHHNGFYNAESGPRPYSSSKAKGRGGSSSSSSSSSSSTSPLLHESQLWSYVVQLSSALRTIHAHNLAARVIDPTKVLLTDKSRLRINCVGIFDVLSFDPSQNNLLAMMPHYQQEDLVSLGKVLLALACNSLRAYNLDNLNGSLELVARNYSTDLKNLFIYLFSNQNRNRSVNDIMPMIGARFFTQLDAAHLRNDVLQNELAKEVENSRLFRLLCKMGVINERPEFHLDPAWSETGDRYMLKLFRDYLFHQVDENGAPWIDMAHVVQCLNKLDAGVTEKVCMMSRDEQSVLVVTYAELKRCLESGFSEVITATTRQQQH